MNEIISSFDSISLDDMSGIRLMNRTDTKFITTKDRLEELLKKAKSQYWMQDIDGMRNMPYFTRYFDTPECQMYISHQNGKKTRQKVRVRSYVNSGLAFIEVKNKNNHGRTKKKRIRWGNIRRCWCCRCSTARRNLITGKEMSLNRLVIIELKRDGNAYSPIRDIMRDLHIYPQGFSKYCMGMALTNESLKRNRFKERLMLLEKMKII